MSTGMKCQDCGGRMYCDCQPRPCPSCSALKAEKSLEVRHTNDALKHLHRIQAERDRLKADYHELIMAVAKKFRGETRHKTALRYIQQAEEPCGASGVQSANTKEGA